MDIAADVVEALAVEGEPVVLAHRDGHVERTGLGRELVDADVVQRVVAVPELDGMSGPDDQDARNERQRHLIHHRRRGLRHLGGRARLEHDDCGLIAASSAFGLQRHLGPMTTRLPRGPRGRGGRFRP